MGDLEAVSEHCLRRKWVVRCGWRGIDTVGGREPILRLQARKQRGIDSCTGNVLEETNPGQRKTRRPKPPRFWDVTAGSEIQSGSNFDLTRREQEAAVI
jgi:hypothetical protein